MESLMKDLNRRFKNTLESLFFMKHCISSTILNKSKHTWTMLENISKIIQEDGSIQVKHEVSLSDESLKKLALLALLILLVSFVLKRLD